MNTIPNRDPTSGRNQGADLRGFRVGEMTLLYPTGAKAGNYRVWRARCNCGNEIEWGSNRFTSHKWPVKSCGCKNRYANYSSPHKCHLGRHYHIYKMNSRSRGISFSLSKEELSSIITSNCHYCGAPPRPKKTGKLIGTFARNGIDRVDSARGYTAENCVPCCNYCNTAKLDRTADEFKAWIAQVYRHMFP